MKENEIIELFHQPGDAARLDDCALIPPGEERVMLATTDSMAEGTHFRLEWSAPEDLAAKLFQSNLSDLAASGGRPTTGLLSLGLPAEHEPDFIRRFAGELSAQFREHNARMVGGDTFRARSMVLSLTLLGTALRNLTRDGGQPGDALYVSGSLGLSLAGLRLLPARDGVDEFHIADAALRDEALNKHLRPRARAQWGRLLAADESVHAAMDVSDGIAQDAPRLARASGLRLEIDLDALPLHPGLEDYFAPGDAAQSGEEYELLFLADENFQAPFPCTRIGRALTNEEIASSPDGEPGPVHWVRGGQKSTLPAGGFRHF